MWANTNLTGSPVVQANCSSLHMSMWNQIKPKIYLAVMSPDASHDPFFFFLNSRSDCVLYYWDADQTSLFQRRVKALEPSQCISGASWEALQSRFAFLTLVLGLALNWFIIRPSLSLISSRTDVTVQMAGSNNEHAPKSRGSSNGGILPVNRHALQIFTTFAPSHFAWGGGAGCRPIACWDCVPLYFKLSL